MKHSIKDVKLDIEPEFRMLHNRIGIFNTHFQNFGHCNIPKAQLILADPPYNLGVNAYASNPSWYIGGDNKNGESDLAGEEFFDTDKDSDQPSLCTFAHRCCAPNRKKKAKHPA